MAFVGNVGGIHDVLHWADGVPIFYKVLGKARFIIPVFKISKVFLETDFKGFTLYRQDS